MIAWPKKDSKGFVLALLIFWPVLFVAAGVLFVLALLDPTHNLAEVVSPILTMIVSVLGEVSAGMRWRKIRQG